MDGVVSPEQLARRRILTRLLVKQLTQIATLLVRPQERYRHFAAGADLAFQAFADFYQRKVGT
jgi:hypothetical protein